MKLKIATVLVGVACFCLSVFVWFWLEFHAGIVSTVQTKSSEFLLLPAFSELVFKNRTVVLLAGFALAVATVILAFKPKHSVEDFALVTSMFLVYTLLLASSAILATTLVAVTSGIYGQPYPLNSN